MRGKKILTRKVGRASERVIGNRYVDANSIPLAHGGGQVGRMDVTTAATTTIAKRRDEQDE